MTRDDVIRMAREAGFYFHDAGHAPTLHTNPLKYSEKCFERFAALVAAAEREACVTPADRLWAKGPGVVTAAIRANGYKVEG